MNTIADTIAKVTLGEKQALEKLSVIPLVRPDTFELDYLTLEEANREGSASITETSMEGTVPELVFRNDADKAVLLMDGEELNGAKQNRIVNLTILAPARSKISIPVSCVEAGRWHHESTEFAVADRAMFSRARARKSEDISASLMRNGQRNSRQGEVWEDIALKAAQMRCESPTAAMASMFESHRGSLEAYVVALQPVEGQVGAIFLIDGEVAGIELFDHTATLQRLMPKLVRSYALDALDTSHHAGRAQKNTTTAQDRLKQLSVARVQSFPAVGEGNDLRLTDEHFAGGALQARGRLVHLCAFPKRLNTPATYTDSSGLVRASIRRRAYH